MLKGIAFDLDGTLVDSLAATFEAFNFGIMQQGGRYHTPSEIMEYFGPGEGEIFARIVGADKAPAAYEAFRNHMDDRMGEVPLHLGVPELLEQLKSTGVPISIVTGRSWVTTEMILKHHRILDRFITVIANDHVSSPKPSPEGLNLALNRMKLAATEIFYVGDSPMDITASHRAGSFGVAALWDLQVQKKLLESQNPHHWAHQPSDVWDLFNQLK